MSGFEGVQALIIEDNPSDANVLRSLLSHLGVACLSMDGYAFIQDIQRIGKPDVMFLDLEMPGINGYEVLEAVRADDYLRDVHVVAYTSHHSEMVVARRLGFDSFLGKPLRSALLGDQLARILNGQPVWETR